MVRRTAAAWAILATLAPGLASAQRAEDAFCCASTESTCATDAEWCGGICAGGTCS